jgi:uncharacterized protein (DUF983 family)
MILRCPSCGVSPMFRPLLKSRTLDQWLTPLKGCPKCRYDYEREPGYFLPATWMVHCFSVLGLGTTLMILAEWFWDLSSLALVAVACIPSLLFSFLFARHSKAIYLALDHWIDPPVVGTQDEPNAVRAPPAGRTDAKELSPDE